MTYSDVDDDNNTDKESNDSRRIGHSLTKELSNLAKEDNVELSQTKTHSPVTCYVCNLQLGTQHFNTYVEFLARKGQNVIPLPLLH